MSQILQAYDSFAIYFNVKTSGYILTNIHVTYDGAEVLNKLRLLWI